MSAVSDYIFQSLNFGMLKDYTTCGIDKYTVLGKYLHFDISNPNKLFTPLFLVQKSVELIRKGKYNNINVLLPEINLSTGCKTTKKLLTTFSSLSPNWLSKCIVKGVKYFGTKGAIFDENMNPILILMCDWNYDNEHININKIMFMVTKDIFTMPDNIIKKAIIKEIFPFCCNFALKQYHILNNYVYTINDIIRLKKDNDNISIVIDDLTDFIYKPVIPKPSLFEEGKVKEFINNNIDMILDDYKGVLPELAEDY